jgi:hypothetical protein
MFFVAGRGDLRKRKLSADYTDFHGLKRNKSSEIRVNPWTIFFSGLILELPQLNIYPRNTEKKKSLDLGTAKLAAGAADISPFAEAARYF